MPTALRAARRAPFKLTHVGGAHRDQLGHRFASLRDDGDSRLKRSFDVLRKQSARAGLAIEDCGNPSIGSRNRAGPATVLAPRLGLMNDDVAVTLLDARQQGVKRAILFTGEHNQPAITAYRALGFERIGEFNITLFDDS